MKWNWEQKNWPEFQYDPSTLSELESQFLQQSGMLLGTLKHIGADEKLHLTIDLMSTEAINACHCVSVLTPEATLYLARDCDHLLLRCS